MHFINAGEPSSAVSSVRELAFNCNYGGRLTDANDRRVLAALLDDFCQLDPVQDKRPMLSEYSLEQGVHVYKDVLAGIRDLPRDQPPELFGFHESASIAKDRRETRALCGLLNKLGEVQGLGQPEIEITEELVQTSSGKDRKTRDICELILTKIPTEEWADLRSLREKFPVSAVEPMNALLI